MSWCFSIIPTQSESFKFVFVKCKFVKPQLHKIFQLTGEATKHAFGKTFPRAQDITSTHCLVGRNSCLEWKNILKLFLRHKYNGNYGNLVSCFLCDRHKCACAKPTQGRFGVEN